MKLELRDRMRAAVHLSTSASTRDDQAVENISSIGMYLHDLRRRSG
ncbi:hypothetical protein ACQEUX_11520 [Micromonospora sp. CA-259024]